MPTQSRPKEVVTLRCLLVIYGLSVFCLCVFATTGTWVCLHMGNVLITAGSNSLVIIHSFEVPAT